MYVCVCSDLYVCVVCLKCVFPYVLVFSVCFWCSSAIFLYVPRCFYRYSIPFSVTIYACIFCHGVSPALFLKPSTRAFVALFLYLIFGLIYLVFLVFFFFDIVFFALKQQNPLKIYLEDPEFFSQVKYDDSASSSRIAYYFAILC